MTALGNALKNNMVPYFKDTIFAHHVLFYPLIGCYWVLRSDFFLSIHRLHWDGLVLDKAIYGDVIAIYSDVIARDAAPSEMLCAHNRYSRS